MFLNGSKGGFSKEADERIFCSHLNAVMWLSKLRIIVADQNLAIGLHRKNLGFFHIFIRWSFCNRSIVLFKN